MKTIAVFAICFAFVWADPINREYREGDRYIYFPDGNGELHLVDLEAPVDNLRVDSSQIRFFLFTRSNPSQRQQIFLNNPQSLRESNFDASKGVKFVVHGWISDADSPVNPVITSANLKYADVNVIVVDWSRYASSINYLSASSKVGSVGVVVAEMVDFLHTQGVPFANIHLVGFSLGGHVVGCAGKNTKLGKVERITGLDPAGPGFGSRNNDRLKETDGIFVEVIHTNAGYLGNGEKLGHLDFFPNGGSSQPGCFINVACSHGRAVDFYGESIGNEFFWGTQCNSVDDARRERCTGSSSGVAVHMGGAWDNKIGTGIYHLQTNRNSPFAISK